MRTQISPNGNPNAFYTELVTAPYAGNAIISTHVYGPSVTHAMTNFSGAGLDWRLSVSFGEKTLTVRLTSCVRTACPSCCVVGYPSVSLTKRAVEAVCRLLHGFHEGLRCGALAKSMGGWETWYISI